MNWKTFTIVFISTIVLLLGGNAIAQTHLNINNVNLIRLGGSVMVAEKQVVENAIAIGGDVILNKVSLVLSGHGCFGDSPF